MSAFRIACAQYPIEAMASLDQWRAKIARWVEEAAQGGAALLVFPEYGSMEIAASDPATMGDLHASLGTVMAGGEAMDAHHTALAAQHGVHILGASRPVARSDGRIVNRARLFAPNGRSGYQDKIVMTRFEREQWGISGGDAIRVFNTALGVIGVSICYDVEFPLIARAQAEAGARLILTPSCTDSMQGYWRVRIGAQARALENQIYVAQAPTVGMAPWSPAVDENYGLAGLYGPPVLDCPDDGVLSLGEEGGEGWTYGAVDRECIGYWREQGAVRPFAHWPEQYLAAPPAPAPVEVINLA